MRTLRKEEINVKAETGNQWENPSLVVQGHE